MMRRALCVLCALAACGAAQAAQGEKAPRRHALLVGIGTYAHSQVPALEGPAGDVAALRDVLVRRWGFRDQDIVSLVDAKATRAAILAGLAALKARSAPDDEIIVYFSGHGTSALDASAGVALPHGSGAFVPADFNPERGAATLLVGRTDLRPALQALESGGRRVWAISDSCYSGRQVRSIALGKPGDFASRMIPLPLGGQRAELRANMARHESAARAPAEPYPYRSTVYLSASSEGETAKDIPRSMLSAAPTLDGKPHGALTDALLRVLEGALDADIDGDGLLTLNEVHRATSDFMGQRAYGHTPQRLPAVVEDDAGLGNRAMLSVRQASSGPRPRAVQQLRLRLEESAAQLRQGVSGVPDVVLVNPREEADFVLRVVGNRLAVIAASGDVVLAGMPAADSAALLAQLRQLSWAQRLRASAERHRRGALAAEIDPPQFGGNFVLGSMISFVARPDREATLVLLNISSDGKVSVLFPFNAAEARPQPAGQVRHIPGSGPQQRIRVQEPVGMDMQFVFAFDQPPPALARLYGLSNADPDDARLLAFERALAGMHGKFTFTATTLRTLKP